MPEPRADRPTLAYVLMGYPRITELFIASEIWRLEQQGLALRLLVIKERDEDRHHPVVDQIRTQPEYLPPTTSLTGVSLVRWLRQNLRRFAPALGRVARRHPIRLARCCGWTVVLAVEGRRGLRPSRGPVRELLRAVEVADRLRTTPEVRHLHAHFAHRTTTVTWFASILTGATFSFTGHAKDIYERSQNPGGLLERKMRAARFVVTCTGANHRHLATVASDVPVHVVYHGLNADFTRLLDTAPPPRPPGRFRVISVGSLVHKKGFDLLIDAVGILRTRGVAVDVAIAGGAGNRSDEIRAQIARLDLESQVRLLGPVSQEELLAEYRGSSLFALPCRITDNGDRDGIPNVMVEAMAAGVPVVSTPVSGIPELVEDGVNGLLVEPESAPALADALERCAADPDLCRRLGAAGAHTVRERFDGDALTRRMVELFTEAAA